MSVALVPEVGEVLHSDRAHHEVVLTEDVAGGEVLNETVLVSSCLHQ